MIKSTGAMARFRPFLLASAAGIGLITGGVAQAQVASGPALPAGSDARVDAGGAVLEAHSTGAQLAVVTPDPYLQIANPGTPTTARDPVNITGVGQIVVDTGNGNGNIGLCTASLINPRTVLFAAHCVNSAPATSYGRAGPGGSGTAVSIGFSNNNLSALQQWIFAGANQYRSNPATFLYNLNQVVYNARSTETGNGFLYADVAMGTLDRPAVGIPTWALLFSALPAPASIGASGTGYHVNIAGYGNNGTGITGANGGIDFRRRVAENFLGGLASLDDFQNFIFGTPTGALPQNLYWIDFDDPRRGTASASPFDFNSFRDNALPNEGGTAPGDSGGPLILDRTFSRQVILGVLSGGFSRFFAGQPTQSYGSNSFYQPLYLYWDYIAANNPYRYVSALAGDGNWNDPTRWVTNVDPNYMIIGPNGQLVNGVPNNPGGTTTDVSGKFGQICFQNTTSSECRDVRTGTETATANPIGTAGLNNDAASVTLTRPAGGALGNEDGVEAVLESHADQGAQALPPATLANGLPGATNFVPNNVDPVRTTGAIGRYFDVTLSANGTTTLDTAVTIDRFTLAGAGARLNIASTGTLTSLIDVTQTTGTMQVNGRLTTQGDYFLMAGGLNGTGTISTPFFTNMLGTISPGASGDPGSLGTLGFSGNVILTSGSRYLVDLGQNGLSDRIVVTAGTGGSTGAANVGGVVAFSFSPATLRAGNVYTILTATGGVTGTFATPGAFSAILTPRLTYTANAVTATIDAGLYANVVGTSAVQRAYAQLLDQNRGNGYAGIYGPLDLQNAATIQATLDGLAPRNQTLKRSLGTVLVDNMLRFTEQRLGALTPGNLDGSLAIIGNPLQVAALASSGVEVGRGTNGIAGQETTKTASLPDGISGFIAAGYIDGDSRPMATAVPLGARDQFNGYYIAGGLESEIGSHGAAGIALSYSNLDGVTTGPQKARAELFQGGVYGKIEVAGPLTLDAQANLGVVSSNTRRIASVIGTTYFINGSESAVTYSGELGLGYAYDVGHGLKVTPRVAVRAGRIGWEGVSETGGGTALKIDPLTSESVQGMGGLSVSGGKKFKPYLSAYFVHDFLDKPGVFGANFVGGIGPNALFGLAAQDKDWAEVAAGISYGTRKLSVALGADTTIGRGDVSNQSYRASLKIGF